MRRYQSVARRQTRDEWQRQRQQRAARGGGQAHDDGEEENQPDSEEDRQADDEAHGGDGPWEPALTDRAHRRARDDGGAARLGQQRADEGAQADDDRDEPQRVADALLERGDDRCRLKTRGESQRERHDHQRKERVHPDAHDQRHQDDDGECRQDERTHLSAKCEVLSAK